MTLGSSNLATSSQNNMLQLVNKTGTVGKNVNEALSRNHCCPGSIIPGPTV
jgi:hypothetical protein